ncbi:MAG: ribokinase [Spirochaetales bacterium]|nr:ribokinase [Spirochaetales bacterium]
MKVLNFGSINIDFVYSVPHIVRPGETLASTGLETFAGGKGANQSIAMGKAGINVHHAGVIGKDGLWVLEQMKASGVFTDYVRVYEGQTGNALIQVSAEGQNSIVLFGGGNQAIEQDDIDKTLSSFGGGDYLVLQNEINRIPEIMEKAASRGMRIFANPAPLDEKVKSWPLELLDTLVVNEIEGQGLTGRTGSYEEVLDSLVRAYPSVKILLTAGKDGAYYGFGQERLFVPIADAPVVDTTAAGDTFFGYFLASCIEGRSVKDAMERATRASAITVSRPGAGESIPFARELDD